jgi:fermentation-respiration switch protein FrsA (DUF1100 family)
MKSRILLFGILFLALTGSGQNSEFLKKITGSWTGPLKMQGIELRLVFNISAGAYDSLTVTLDSPDQGAKGIATSRVVATNDSLRVEIKSLRGIYTGKFNEDYTTLSGQWKQGGLALPLELKHNAEAFKLNRPQEPEPPYPYNVEEVTFRNEKAGIDLAGTLTIPLTGSNFPAVVLITGSGPQNRDEELMGHKPFLVISDWLTRQGVAVLRYDDRGVGKSGGKFGDATTFDFAGDAEAGFDFLKKYPGIDTTRCGLAGHSEGGLIAPIIAAGRDDIGFIILLAGPGIPGDQIIMLQTELISRAEGVPENDIADDLKLSKDIFSVLRKTADNEKASVKITKLLDGYNRTHGADTMPDTSMRAQTDMQVKTMTSPWFRTFLRINPIDYLSRVKCPVLAMNGELDLQVPAAVNLQAIERALIFGGNSNYRIEGLPGLNHLFQHAEKGSPSEYGKIEETFAPEALTMISGWINK